MVNETRYDLQITQSGRFRIRRVAWGSVDYTNESLDLPSVMRAASAAWGSGKVFSIPLTVVK